MRSDHHNDQPKSGRMADHAPFDLADKDAYLCWREQKLAGQPSSSNELLVEIRDLAQPSVAEQEAIIAKLRWSNMAVYACRPADDEEITRAGVGAFAHCFGLQASEAHRSMGSDGIVALEVVSDGPRHGYIPYTNRKLSWHTDGYYNAPGAEIRSFILHCVRDARSGGENGMIDPEIAYIRLRDKDPRLIEALMRADAMTIPSNTEKDGSVRPASVGPVFFVEASSGKLQMRYSARARNIIWRDDDATQAATAALLELSSECRDVIKHRLQPGQGLICNNVMHNRSSFTDDTNPETDTDSAADSDSRRGRGRLYFRARFGTRVRGT